MLELPSFINKLLGKSTPEKYADFNLMSCPPVPPIPAAKVGSESAKLMQAAGITTCSTSNTTAQMEAQISSGFGPSAGAKASFSDSATIGCEQIAVIAEKYNKTVQNVACMLNSSANVVKQPMSGINSITFDAGRDLMVDCNPLKINQKMVLKMISNINLSEKELNQVDSAIKDVVKSVTDVVSESKNGLGATPQGSKMIKDAITDINNIDTKQQIKQSIKDIELSMAGKNVLAFRAGRDLIIQGKDCEIKQDMLIEMVASTIVNDSLSNSLSSLSEAIVENDTKSVAKSENVGAEALALKLPEQNAFMGMIIIVVAIIAFVMVGGKVVGGPLSLLTDPKKLIMVLISVAIVGTILYFLFFNKKKEGFRRRTEDKVEKKQFSGF
jgi:hypothetical protein